MLKKKKKDWIDFLQLYAIKTLHFAELAITALKKKGPLRLRLQADDPYKTPRSELCYAAVSICQGVFWFEDTTSAVVSCN